MTKTSVIGFQPARRRLLRGALTGAAFFGLGGAAAQAKASQRAVAYRGSPKGGESCANCGLFVPPNACESVAGKVSSNGWCRIWTG